MSGISHLPVLVVGAGPTGLITANLLGAFGIQTVLVEAKPTVNRRPRSTFLDDVFFRLLDAVGLADLVRRQVLGPATYEHYSALGFVLSREDGQITSHNFPTRSAIYQPWFDQTLLDGLARYKHVETLFEHEFVDLVDEGDRVTVQLRHGEHTSSRAFSYVLAADGGRSPVREKLGVNFEVVSPQEARSLRVDVEGDPDTTLVMRSRPGFGRSASSFPGPNGRRYGFHLRPGEDADKLLTDESLRELFKPYFDFDKVRIINKAHYTFRARLAEKFRVGRVFLLGDAAHTQSPAGSQGMNGGARDANALVWKVAAVLQGLAGRALLDLYETERRPQVRATLAMATKGMYGRSGRSIPAIVIKDLWAKLKQVSHFRQPVWKQLANAAHVVTGRVEPLTEGLISGQVSGREDDVLGRVLPNPWVEVSARGQLLDSLLGAGFSLVGFQGEGAGDGEGTGDPRALFSHELWSRLQARIVVLHRGEARQAAGDTEPVLARVADHRLDVFWQAQKGQWLLVRPDRIVAAVFKASDASTVAEDLSSRLGRASAPRPAGTAATASAEVLANAA